MNRRRGDTFEAFLRWQAQEGPDRTGPDAMRRFLEELDRNPKAGSRAGTGIKALALARGLNPNTVQQRLARGWPLQRALSEPADTSRKPGRSGIADRARAAGIPRTTVYRRLDRGWTLERALSEPVQPQQHKRTGERGGALKADPKPR